MTNSAEKIYFEVAGPGLEPENAPTTLALEAASAFFSAIEKVVRIEKRDVSFSGLSVENKCIQFSATASDGHSAFEASVSFHEALSGEKPVPRGISDEINRMRRVSKMLPLAYELRSRVGQRKHLRLTSASPDDLLLWGELASLRGRVESVGGATPKARFSSAFEAQVFSLEASEEMAKSLAKYLYDEVEIEAKIFRDLSGRIREGQIERFYPLEGAADMESLRKWYYSVGGDEWDAVDDVERELKRD